MFYLAHTSPQFPIIFNRPFPPGPHVWKEQTLPSNPSSANPSLPPFNPVTYPQEPNPTLFIADMPLQSPLASGAQRNMDAALNKYLYHISQPSSCPSPPWQCRICMGREVMALKGDAHNSLEAMGRPSLLSARQSDLGAKTARKWIDLLGWEMQFAASRNPGESPPWARTGKGSAERSFQGN